jgi:hypothetical protein
MVSKPAWLIWFIILDGIAIFLVLSYVFFKLIRIGRALKRLSAQCSSMARPVIHVRPRFDKREE